MVSRKKSVRSFILFSMLVLALTGIGFCNKSKQEKEQEQKDLLGLMYLLQSNSSESSGFIIQIPQGVAK